MSTVPTGMRADDAWEYAYKHSLDITSAEIAEYLLGTLGPRVASTALGMTDARQLRAWRAGHAEPRSIDVQARLRLLYRITYAVAATYGAATATLFLRSASPRLGERAPMTVLRDGPVEEVQVQLLAATRSFLEG